MAVSIGTGNKFCMHFRLSFPKEPVSLDLVMKDPVYARRLAGLASGASGNADLKAAAAALLAELSGEASKPSGAAAAALAAAGDQWELLGQCARAAGGPIAGAMVAKFRKDKPGASVFDAKGEFGMKLGSKFLAECAARGL